MLRKIIPQVTWGTSPEMVVAVDEKVPDPANEPELVKRQSMQRALDYMGLEGGEKITDIQP